ncbi:MAG TPA: alpha/beta hydrolase [Candidatus Angelobacter sp.]|nr:alpha/beta hydrolase [Candidatus Angelobacter sp.]
MNQSTFILRASDGVDLFVRRWLPTGVPKAVVQIAHGLAEHSERYARLAEALTGVAYAVYANDHRGHGHTVKTPAHLGLFADRDGWRKCLDDLWMLNGHITGEHPGAPIFLLGHSMGSTMALQFIMEHGESIAGAVLSGPSGQPTAVAKIGRFITWVERLRLGRRGHSALVGNLTFRAFNKRFAPARTEFDWLSRDPAEVDKYVADPLCGFPAGLQVWVELLAAWTEISRPASYERIPKDLPVYVMAGKRDPVSAGARQVQPMLAAFRAVGLKNVECRIYADARHELLNEINRDEVTRDLIDWLDGVVGTGAGQAKDARSGESQGGPEK